MEVKKLENGERIWYDEGWIFFEGKDGEFNEASAQHAPVDRFDYRYTHGGSLYREACEIFDLV